MKMLNVVRSKLAMLLALAVSMVVGSPAAMASSPDFSGILSDLDTGTMVTAILAACAIIALVGFAKWGGKKLARFFG